MRQMRCRNRPERGRRDFQFRFERNITRPENQTDNSPHETRGVPAVRETQPGNHRVH